MVGVNKSENEFNEKKFRAFCNQYLFSFPQDFILYLKKHNDAELEPNVLDVHDNECCIRYFYGTSIEAYADIWDTYEVYKERMPKKCIPIADADFGNQICMSLQEDTYGKIYFWDHELIDTDEMCEINIKDMNEVAVSFTDLLSKINESPYVVEIEEKPNFLRTIMDSIKKK